LLTEAKVKHRFLTIAGNTRMNLTVSNRKTHKQTRLSFPGPLIKGSELKEMYGFLDNLKSQDIVMIGGSLPPGIDPLVVAKMIRHLKKRNVLCMVDMPGKILSKIISKSPHFIKPNLIEFQDLVGKKVESITSILPLVRKLNKSIPLVCVSSVEGGAILVTKDEAWFGKIPKVKIKSTVGAGDSMVGAIAAQLSKNPTSKVQDLLRVGLAASCATLTEDGMELGSREEMNRYLPKILIREIK
jgi:1-phosphofructokinase family hexose kinase